MSNFFWCGKCGGTFDPSHTYCPNCDGAVVMEQQERIAELEAEVQRLKKRIEIVSKAAPDPQTLRNMLRAMQAGEMTVSRGVELVDMWLAGNYSDDMLPPVREGLGEDEMPWDRIDALVRAVADHVTVRGERTQQRDELLATLGEVRISARMEVTRMTPELLSFIEAAIAKVKQ